MKKIEMLVGEDRLSYLRKALRYCRKEYNKIRSEETCHCSHSAVKAMKRTEEKYVDLGTFGTEGFCWTHTAGFNYLNTGETYCLTICFRSDHERFTIDSYGDFVERNPKLVS